MSQNYILGSGIIGCLAKHVLRDYKLIPFGRSRFYTYLPLAENYITYTNELVDFMKPFCGGESLFCKSPYSYQGQLLHDDSFKSFYLYKVYGVDVPGVADKFNGVSYTCFNIPVTKLYSSLQSMYSNDILVGNSMGKLSSIDVVNKKLYFNNGSILDYDNLISTIPLDSLVRYCGKVMDLKFRPSCFYRILTNKVDLEGADFCYVADPEIDFYKVVKLGDKDYLFMTVEAVDNPYQYFGAYLGYNIDIVEAQRIEQYISLGDAPDLSFLEKYGLYCVGSCAQWDDYMNISSSLNKLFRLADNFKSNISRLIIEDNNV